MTDDDLDTAVEIALDLFHADIDKMNKWSDIAMPDGERLVVVSTILNTLLDWDVWVEAFARMELNNDEYLHSFAANLMHRLFFAKTLALFLVGIGEEMEKERQSLEQVKSN